jgi:hypothetical protein
MKERGRRDPNHPRVGPSPEDRRGALQLSATENADLCRGCVKCCTYITVEIDSPRAAWEYDQWIWALHHERIQLYVERPERWYLHIEAVCRQLNEQGRCKIYGRHPVLCREYDPRTCERRLPLSDIRAWFDDAEQFEAWVQRERPAHWKRLMTYRNDMPQGPPVADGRRGQAEPGGLVTLEGLVGIAAGTPSRGHKLRRF